MSLEAEKLSPLPPSDPTSVEKRLSNPVKRNLSLLCAIGLFELIAACGQPAAPDQNTAISSPSPVIRLASPTATLVDRIAGPVIRRSPIAGATIEPTLTQGERRNLLGAAASPSPLPLFGPRPDPLEAIR